MHKQRQFFHFWSAKELSKPESATNEGAVEVMVLDVEVCQVWTWAV